MCGIPLKPKPGLNGAPKQDKRPALVGRQISGLLTSLAPGTGAPGSHQRTWEEKAGGEAPTKAFNPDQGSVTPAVKACEKNHFQPRYAGANLGHPSMGQGLAGSRESGGKRTANRLGCRPNEQPAWRPKQDKRPALVGRQISGLLTSLAPWTGAPGSHQRTWEEKAGGEAPTKAFISRSRFSYPCSESIRKKPFSTQVRWCEPGKKKPGAKPPPKLLYPDQGSVTPAVKAFEKNHFQPRYAGANLGHPSRGQGLAGSRESGGERTANRLTELTSFLF